MRRFSVVHIGLAAMVAATSVTAAGWVHAAGSSGGAASVLTPIAPCRLVDTRPGVDNVGARATPLGSNETATFQVTGTNGNCTVPTSATGVVTNTTVVDPSNSSYVTVFPADAAPRPTASSLNFVAGQPPTSNQVTVGLSTTGAIGVYNLSGRVDLIVDIVGYYQAASGGGAQSCPAAGCIAYFTGLDAANVDGSHTFSTDACLGLGGASGLALMPLDLPSGALIESMRVRYRDAFAGTVDRTEFKLYSMDEAGGLVARSSLLRSTDTASSTAAEALPLTTGGVAQGRTSQYLLQIGIRGGGQSFCGAEVTYRLG
jgi:hypothetical protein